MSRAGLAALARQQQPGPKVQQPQQRSTPLQNRSTASALQGGLSEDEALRRALEASMRDVGPASASGQMSQEEQDRMLAEAIAQSEREAAAQQQQRQRQQSRQTATASEGSNCQIS